MGTSYKGTVTLEDIARCKGESQSFFARAYHQLQSLWKNHTFVTDDMVNDIMKSYGLKNVQKISSVFKEALPEALNKTEVIEHKLEAKDLKKDLDIASDLLKIFENTAKNALNDSGITTSKEKKLKEFTNEMAKSQAEVQKAQIILQGKKALEKYDPIDLLRAENYEAAAGLKDELKGIRKDFIDHLNQQPEYPKKKEDLEKSYREFINKTVKRAASDPECLSKMKGYPADKPMNFFFIAIQGGNTLAKKFAISEIPELFAGAYEKKIIQSPKIFTNNPSNGLPDNKNSALKTQQFVDEFIHGTGVDATLKEFTAKDGKKIMIPQQALLDIPRSTYISLNNHLAYSSKDKEKYTVESYYHSVHQALDGSDSATNAVLILTSQGMFTNPIMHILSSYHDLDIYPKLQKDSSINFQYHINIEGDKVKLILKNAYNIADDSVGDEVVSMGRHIVKTEITLSLSELKLFDPANPQTNLKTIEVSDTYSPLIHDLGMISSEKTLQNIFNQF